MSSRLPADTVNRVVVALQRGIPLAAHPYRLLGAPLGVDEEQVLEILADQFASGRARRLGGLFDSRRLGFRSTLCAVRVPLGDLDRLGEDLGQRATVTHAYARVPYEDVSSPQRSDLPNLWFTVAVAAAGFDAEMAALRQLVVPHVLLELPAAAAFKIGVVLDPAGGRAVAGQLPEPSPLPPVTPGAPDLAQDPERTLVRLLQGSLPLVCSPFAGLAQQSGCSPGEVLARLRAWSAAGVLRRIALVLHHRRAGFAGNAMCIWDVDETVVPELGAALAAQPMVTHCYHRVRSAVLPYNLFAMIHGRDWTAARSQFMQLAAAIDLGPGRMLCSIRQYAKTSPRYID